VAAPSLFQDATGVVASPMLGRVLVTLRERDAPATAGGPPAPRISNCFSATCMTRRCWCSTDEASKKKFAGLARDAKQEGQTMHRTFSKLAIVGAAFAVIVGITVLIIGQPTSKLSRQPASPHHVGVVDDWSFHHLVFSNPGTYEQVKNDPAAYSRWLSIQYDTRYIMQQMKRSGRPAASSALSTSNIPAIKLIGDPTVSDGVNALALAPKKRSPQQTLKKDWSAPLITGAVLPNMFPAKYTFNPIGPASCASDYVAYPTGSTGSTTAATIVAYNELYGTTGPSGTGCGATTGVTVPSVYWAYNTGGTTYSVTTSPVLSSNGTEVAFIQSNGTAAQLVVVAVAPNQATITTATGNVSSSSTSVTSVSGITAADVGMQISDTSRTGCIPANDTIAAYSSGTVTLATATGSGCGTHTGDSLTVTTEAVGTPAVPPSGTPSSCTAPCMATLTFSHSGNDTYSSPFYDYTNDALYVGDNKSYLHKFTGVFKGSPTEATAVLVNSTTGGYDLASPVYDSTSGCVFVGDAEGYLYSVRSGNGGTVCTGSSFALFGQSELLSGGGTANTEGIFDGLLVDSSAEMVYAFVAWSAAITGSSYGSCGAGYNCVAQFAASTITSSCTNCVPVGEENLSASGTDSYNGYLYSGAFDNVYFSSLSGTSPSGNLYVMGNNNVNAGTNGILYQVPITSNAMGTPKSIATINAGQPAWGSPVTEFCNNGTSACGVDPQRNVTGTLKATSPNVSLSAGNFTSADVGSVISGTGIPPGDTIASLVGSSPYTEANLTTAPTAETSETLIIVGLTNSGTDYIFASAFRGLESAAGTFGSATSCYTGTGDEGCVFAVNVSIPASISAASSGMLITSSADATSGHAACWGTGGIVVDNSSTTPAGASNVYFLNLNGNFPAAAPSTCNSNGSTTDNTIQAVQAAQSPL